MSAQPADQRGDELSAEAELHAEVMGLIEDLREEFGDDAVALRALARSYVTLLGEADRSCSRGFLRGRFSAGARPLPVVEEP